MSRVTAKLTRKSRRNALIPQRLAGLQRVGDALLGFTLTAEADERLALQIEDVLLRNGLWRGDRSAGKDISELSGHDAVVFGGVFAAHEHVNAEPGRGIKFLPEDADFRGRGRMISGTNHCQRRLLRIGNLAVAI